MYFQHPVSPLYKLKQEIASAASTFYFLLQGMWRVANKETNSKSNHVTKTGKKQEAGKINEIDRLFNSCYCYCSR